MRSGSEVEAARNSECVGMVVRQSSNFFNVHDQRDKRG